jgi:general secretion pathway protein I
MSRIEPAMVEPDEAGFSLLEALVAMAVLAVAAAGLIRAAEAHVDRIGLIERRAAAMWVAEASLADIRLQRRPAGPGVWHDSMAGLTFDVRTETAPTDDPELVRVMIGVRLDGQAGLLARLDGFAERAAETR